MKADEIYATLYKLADPILEHYRKDLEVHDRNAILNNEGVPFIYAVYHMATHIEFMHKHDSDYWPSHGEWKPYLFGRVNRWQKLHSIGEAVTVNLCGGMYKVFYFNGKTIMEVAPDEGKKLWQEYARSIENKWRAEERAIGEMA